MLEEQERMLKVPLSPPALYNVSPIHAESLGYNKLRAILEAPDFWLFAAKGPLPGV